MIADNAVQAAQINSDAVTTAKILNNNVTVEKMQQVAGHAILARVGSSTANLTQITAGNDHVLRRSGSGNLAFGTLVTANIGADQITNALMADDAIGTAQIADDAIGVAQLADDAVTGPAIADDAVTHEHMETSAALSVLGVTGNSSAHVADITAADGKVLRRSGNALEFGEIATTGIADDAVTNAKVADDAIQAAQLATDSVGNDALDLDGISVYGASGTAAAGSRVYINTGNPSGGDNGDIWLKYTA